MNEEFSIEEARKYYRENRIDRRAELAQSLLLPWQEDSLIIDSYRNMEYCLGGEDHAVLTLGPFAVEIARRETSISMWVGSDSMLSLWPEEYGETIGAIFTANIAAENISVVYWLADWTPQQTLWQLTLDRDAFQKGDVDARIVAKYYSDLLARMQGFTQG